METSRGRPGARAARELFDVVGNAPSESRGFIHKQAFAAIGSALGYVPIPGASIVGQVFTGMSGAGAGSAQQRCTVGFEPDGRGGCRRINLFSPAGLGPTTQWPGLPTSPWSSTQEAPGDAVVGQYGVALEPQMQSTQRAFCIKGMVLGSDNLCYNRGAISNKQRKWPRGRRPLLTGGERNCITTAARAARKVEATTKQLQDMGMLKKPVRRSAPRAPVQRQLMPGTSIVNVE